MKKRLLVISGLLLVLIASGLWVVVWAPNLFEGDRFIIVSKGESFASVVDSLDHAGIIWSRTTFQLAGRILDLTTKMQIGKYRFRSGMSNHEILEDLRGGNTIEMISVTIPEGLRATRQAHIFVRQLGIDSTRFMELVYDQSFCHELGIEAPSLEGYLMPNTYKVYWQSDEKDLLKRMVGQFWTVFDSSMQLRSERRGMSISEVLTIASIVEGETHIDSERAVIAGVYYNRIHRRMPLQADPTIQYLLQEGPRPLHRSDLQIPSPYNTYLHYGLPPGPVNNPGRAAIVAALYPVRHKFLYFVANGAGGHTFSRSYDQHLRAIRQYLKRREEQRASREEQ